MSTFTHHELLLFIRTVAVGAVLLLCYDLLRALRDVFAHSRKITEAEDLIYWLCCTVFVFTEIYRTNDGILRFFYDPRNFAWSVDLPCNDQYIFCKMLYQDHGNSCYCA